MITRNFIPHPPLTRSVSIILATMLFTLTSTVTISAVPVASVPDVEISSAIESALLMDRSVSAHLVDVATEEGIVTLSGTVDDLLAQDRAVSLTRHTKGVRSVIDRLEVSPVKKSDKQILKDTRQAIALDPVADSYEISVDVSDGKVALKGTVESPQEKKLTEQVVKGVEGIKAVVNNIEVEYEMNRSDKEISAEIEKRYKTDVRLRGTALAVNVAGGEVTVSGFVASAADRLVAYELAEVAGVRNVSVEEVEIRWWSSDSLRRDMLPTFSDEQVEQSIYDAFAYDPRVSLTNPNVRVDNNAVTLRGAVNDYAAMLAAERIAKNTVGVRKVKNHLKVRPTTKYNDSILQHRVEAFIRRSPDLRRTQIKVQVFNSKAYLSGNVNSQYEKDRAKEVTSRLAGIVAIENNIRVMENRERLNDLVIEDNVNERMYWSPLVNGSNIEVTVDNGVATLSGKVATFRQQNKAIGLALEAGALHVRDRIKVVNEFLEKNN